MNIRLKMTAIIGGAAGIISIILATILQNKVEYIANMQPMMYKGFVFLLFIVFAAVFYYIFDKK